MKSGNPNSGIYQTDKSRTIDVNGGDPGCYQGGIMICDPARTLKEEQPEQMEAKDVHKVIEQIFDTGKGYE